MALFGSKKKIDEAVQAAKAEFACKVIAIRQAAKDEMATVTDQLQAENSALQEKIKEIEIALVDAENTHKEEIEKIQTKHLDEIACIRRENAIQTQQMIEFIDNRKDELGKKSEKELLISAVMALDGYAKRIERLEQNMEFREIEAKMKEMRKEFSDSLDGTQSILLEKIGKVQNDTEVMLDQAENKITIQIKDNTDDLSEKVSSMNTMLSGLMNSMKLPEKLGSLSDQIDDLYLKLSEEVDELERRIMEKLESFDVASSLVSIQGTVDRIDSSVDNLEEKMNDSLERLDEKVRDTLDEVKSELSSYSITDAVSDLRSDISNLDDLKRDVDEMKEYICSSYSSDSIPNKIERLEDLVKDAREAAEAAKDAAEHAAGDKY